MIQGESQKKEIQFTIAIALSRAWVNHITQQVSTSPSLMNEPFVCLPQVVCVALPGMELPTELPTKPFLVPGKDHEGAVSSNGDTGAATALF